jgi:hypothetical protein
MSRYISKLPPEIRELAEKRRSEQCIETISDYLAARFEWRITEEGYDFWQDIEKKNYSVFYEKYPQKDKLDELIEWTDEKLPLHLDKKLSQSHIISSVCNHEWITSAGGWIKCYHCNVYRDELK